MANRTIEVFITSDSLPSRELKRCLENLRENIAAEVHLELRETPFQLRSPDPTILVALVGVVGAGLATLLAGVLKIAEAAKKERIVLQGKDGQRLEVPASTSIEKIDQLIDKLKTMDTGRITVEM